MRYLVLIFALLIAAPAFAQSTYTANSCSESDVETAITNEQAHPVDGDIISIPSGSCIVTPGLDYLSPTGVVTGNTGGTYILGLTDTANTSSTACYDSSATGSTGSGLTTPAGFESQVWSTSSTSQSGPTIVPSTSSGVVIASNQELEGPILAVTSPTGAILTCPVYPGQTDSSKMCTGNAYLTLFFNTSAASETWGWTNGTTENAAMSAIHIPAATTVTTGCTIALLGAGPC
jgi:hypothetical protein